ncbi:MAG: DUF2070 family protein [archaeon]|nr:DUF2070 family protein [archaeon]
MSSMKTVANLSRYILSLPKVKNTAIFIIVISIVYGILLAILNHPLSLIYVGNSALFGLLVCGFSALVCGLTHHKWVAYFNGINLKIKHSMFLGLAGMLLLIVMNLIGIIFGKLINVDLGMSSFLFGCSLIFAFDFLVIWGVTQTKLRYAVFISFIQPLLTFILLTATSDIGLALALGIIGTLFKLVITCLIFLIAIYLFVRIAEAPMQKNFDFSVLKLLSYFVAHMNEKLLLMEELFESMGEEIETLVGIVSFKKKNGEDKALFLSPYVHPGPLGTLGGGNMPTVLAEKFSQFTMVAHGPSTHDFNPVSVSEIDKIEESVKSGLSKIEYSANGSEFKRYNYKDANIGVQFFNNGNLMLSTLAPKGSDDIDFSVGLSLMLENERLNNTKNGIVVDCHNSFNPEVGKISGGNPQVLQLIQTVGLIDNNITEYPIKVGCNHHDCKGLYKKEGIGDSKLKTMVIEVNNQKTAYVLFDSNNMELGLRERIFKEIKESNLVDEIEVMTTDTHFVNTLSNGYNPVGVYEKETVIESIKESIQLAIDDLEEVEAGCIVEKIKNIKTMGIGRYSELISTISATASVAKITFPIIFIISILFILTWVFGIHIMI